MSLKSTVKCSGICSECGKCKGANLLKDAHGRKTKLVTFPSDFIAQTGHAGYGVAFDIGTTTVVAMLWNLTTGKELGAAACTNPQNEYGADVISRITYCDDDPQKFVNIRSKIIEGLNKLTSELTTKFNVDKDEILRVTVGGNTTMSHIFAGYPPASLARAPFSPMYTGTLQLKQEDLGLMVSEGAQITLLPNIAGHVGGDIVAGIVASRILDQKKLTLFLDIGTNGEIVLAGDGVAMTCSTAAGPAFEGATIRNGMRAAPGAIEKIQIKGGEVFIKTVDDAEPVGICGSGIIDVMAEMLGTGLINFKGRLASKEDLEKIHPESPLADRLVNTQDGREFILVYKEGGEDIVVTQKDIREVQLAKGAVAAGISIMLKRMGKKTEDIHKIIIAGAFGNFIHKESAVAIGLIPSLSMNKIISAGNTAGAGVSMALMSDVEMERTKSIPNRVEHIELASCSDFQDEYMKALAF
jgi:uncharacterized 2Fe-2S/4Fe-4S cluster protein (DUF4445 family)